MSAADMLLLERLKTAISNFVISKAGAWGPMDYLEIYSASVEYKLPKLETWCVKTIATDIESYLSNSTRPQFLRTVLSSASWVRDRQLLDSIPLVDELRYFIGRRFGVDEAQWDTVMEGIKQGAIKEGDWIEEKLVDGQKLERWRKFVECVDLLDEALSEVGVEV
ncbi:hypothetical protein HDU93_002843 [Gonapodya sp. JEL0774]|nr:hypothetical protein HDU93_002843 [Gonapodya sp. JEL0774]